MCTLKTIQMNLFTKQIRHRLTDIDNKCMITKGDSGEDINWKFALNR